LGLSLSPIKEVGSHSFAAIRRGRPLPQIQKVMAALEEIAQHFTLPSILLSVILSNPRLGFEVK